MERIVFFGSSRLSQEFMKALVESSGFGEVFEIVGLVTSSEFAEGAKTHLNLPRGLTVIYNEKKSESLIDSLVHETSATMFLSVQHPWIFSDRLLQLVDYRAINLHNASLPNYKGHNCISHEILNGEKLHETTLHWIAPEVDAGRIIDIESIPITDHDTALSVYRQSIVSTGLIARRLAKHLVDKQIPFGTLQIEQGTFYHKADLDKFRLIEFGDDIESIALRARALFFPPLGVASIEYPGGSVALVPKGEFSVFQENWERINSPNWEENKK